MPWLLYSAGRSTRVDGLDRYQRMRVHPLRERQREESPSLELGYCIISEHIAL